MFTSGHGVPDGTFGSGGVCSGESDRVNLADRQHLYNGFGDALARAVELAVTPAIFGWLGWLLDGRVGTRPLFTVVFTLFVFSYVFWKMWGGYERQMQAHEERMGLRNDD